MDYVDEVREELLQAIADLRRDHKARMDDMEQWVRNGFLTLSGVLHILITESRGLQLYDPIREGLRRDIEAFRRDRLGTTD